MQNKARADQPTHIYVRNLLNVPDDAEQIYDMLGEKERLGLALSRIARDVTDIKTRGCDVGAANAARIGAFEQWQSTAMGVVKGVGISAALITFLIGMYYFFAALTAK